MTDKGKECLARIRQIAAAYKEHICWTNSDMNFILARLESAEKERDAEKIKAEAYRQSAQHKENAQEAAESRAAGLVEENAILWRYYQLATGSAEDLGMGFGELCDEMIDLEKKLDAQKTPLPPLVGKNEGA